MCNLALSNCHVCDNHATIRSVIENKVCNIRTAKLNIVRSGTCESDRPPFMTRPAMASLMRTLNKLRSQQIS